MQMLMIMHVWVHKSFLTPFQLKNTNKEGFDCYLLQEIRKWIVYKMEEMGSCPRKVERDEGDEEDEEISTHFLQMPKQLLLSDDEEENEGE